MAARTVAVRLLAEIAGYTGPIEKAARSTDKLADSAEKTAKQHRSAWDTVGRGATVAAAVGVVAVGAMVAAYAGFDKEMSNVRAATGETGEGLKALSDAALQAGKDTVFSATEAAQAETELAKAGVSTADILGGALTGALDLAAAGQIGVADAAGIAATAMTQFGLSGSQVPHIADLLAAGAGKAQGEVTDLAVALKYVGPVAHQMGISIEETTGVLAELASQGILADQAGTSLRGMLTGLTSPSKIAAKTMKDLGINVYNAQGNFVGFEGIAGQLQSRLGGLTSAQRDQAFGMIFGNEQITAARVLYAGGAAAVKDWTAKVNDAGFAQEQAAAKTDNLRGDIERLGGSLETALIQGGSSANGMIRELVQGVDALIGGFAELPGPLQKTAVGLVVVGTAGAGALALFGSIGPKIRTARAELDGMGTVGARANRAIGLAGRAVGASVPVLGLAAAALSVYAQRKEESAGRVRDFTSAIIADNGALGENTRQVAVNTLEQAGALKAAQTFRLNLQDVTDAALGNQVALGRVNSVLDLYARSQQEAASAGDVNNAQAKEADDAYRTLRDALGGTNSEVQQAVEAAKRQTQAQGEQVNSTDAAARSARGAAVALGEQKSAAEQLKSALDALNETNLTAAEADIRYRDSVAGVTEAIKQNGRTLDLNTQKGRDNRTAIYAAIRASSTHAQAVADQTGSVDKGTAVFASHMQQLRKVAPAGSALRREIDKLIGTYGKVPKKVDTNVKAPGAPTARQQMDAVTRAANGIPDVVSTRVSAYTGGATAAIRNVVNLLAGLHDRTVTVNVIRAGQVNPSGGYASGTESAASGPHWVGERGPELMWLKGGEKILDAAASARYARNLRPVAGGPGGGRPVLTVINNVSVAAAPGMDEAALARKVAGRVNDLLGSQADLLFRSGTGG